MSEWTEGIKQNVIQAFNVWASTRPNEERYNIYVMGQNATILIDKFQKMEHDDAILLRENVSPVVSSKTTHPENGIIRVTFSEITFSLSLVEASWLAGNIQREIRTVEREHPDLRVPRSK